MRIQKSKKIGIRRRWVQLLSTVAHNAWLPGFAAGTIWKGETKYVCTPGFNCYSCPGALGACPVGALQAVIGSRKYNIAWYVIGTLLLFGLAAGRWICGWLCPFGLLQDLLHKIPGKKARVPKKLRWLKYTKYVLLAVFVILLPMLVVNFAGLGDPWFCKYICPVGTVEGALPLLAMNESLREAAGLLFAWKALLALLILVACVFLYRFFCRFLCPLGAIYGLMNRISLHRMAVDGHRCTSCGACSRACKLDVEPYKTPNSAECIRCGDCVKACPHNALKLGFGVRDAAPVSTELEK